LLLTKASLTKHYLVWRKPAMDCGVEVAKAAATSAQRDLPKW